MKNILDKSFFNGSAATIARKLLGMHIARKIGKKTIKLPITEVEAYNGPNDKASHASRGKTKRNKIMFGEAGKWYIYFVYGNHWMLNIVTGKIGYPAAILIRGAGNISGPGRLTKFLKIGKYFNGKPATWQTGLWIEKGIPIPSSKTTRTPRIGVDYAGPTWSKKKYRFVVKKQLRG